MILTQAWDILTICAATPHPMPGQTRLSPFQYLCPMCGLQSHSNTFICKPSRMALDFCSNRTAPNRTYAGRHFKEAFVNPHPKFQGDCFVLYFGLKSRKLDIVQGAWLKSNRPLWQRLQPSKVGRDCDSSFRSFGPRSGYICVACRSVERRGFGLMVMRKRGLSSW